VALAGAIIPGVARVMVMLSVQADAFGVGITVVVGSMLVPPNSVITGWIVPSGGFARICGVESGKAAPLVGGPPGVELHTVVDELPRGGAGDMVPVVLPTIGVGMVPNGVAGVVAVDDVVIVNGVGTDGGVMEGGGRGGTTGGAGAVMTVKPETVVINDTAGAGGGGGGLFVVDVEEEACAVVLVADMEVTGTDGVPGASCPVGVEHVTTVPGIVGSEASGTGVSVVSGAPGWVAAENGLGPLSGEDTIAPGVDGTPMAVLPMVETCARPALQPHSSAASVNNMRRIAWPPSAPI
jgi:hypothetical protein